MLVLLGLVTSLVLLARLGLGSVDFIKLFVEECRDFGQLLLHLFLDLLLNLAHLLGDLRLLVLQKQQQVAFLLFLALSPFQTAFSVRLLRFCGLLST
jgi:hypothetical protein